MRPRVGLDRRVASAWTANDWKNPTSARQPGRHDAPHAPAALPPGRSPVDALIPLLILGGVAAVAAALVGAIWFAWRRRGGARTDGGFDAGGGDGSDGFSGGVWFGGGSVEIGWCGDADGDDGGDGDAGE